MHDLRNYSPYSAVKIGRWSLISLEIEPRAMYMAVACFLKCCHDGGCDYGVPDEKLASFTCLTVKTCYVVSCSQPSEDFTANRKSAQEVPTRPPSRRATAEPCSDLRMVE